MKKILLGLCLVFLAAAPAGAQIYNRAAASPTVLKHTEQIQNRVQNQIEAIEARREQFQERLQNIRDERKRGLTETINNQLNRINERAVTAMRRHLKRLETLLKKIKEQVPETDITAAQEKINTAEAAVNAQAEKDYVIEFTDESGLKTGVSAAKTQLRADLKLVRDLIQTARQTVVTVLKSAKTL